MSKEENNYMKGKPFIFEENVSKHSSPKAKDWLYLHIVY